MKKNTINILKYTSYTLSFIILILAVVLTSMLVAQDATKQDKKMSNNPIVVLQTSKGNIEIELFLNESPITAGNFKELVESGFYDGTKFHRVIKDFMIQGGDPLTKNDSLMNRWGTGGPGYAIKDEFIRGLSNTRGTLSMANSGPNSGGSQFFINVGNNTFLDWDKAPATSKHPVFGKVVVGMDVVDAIVLVKTAAQDRPAEAIVINKAYIKN